MMQYNDKFRTGSMADMEQTENAPEQHFSTKQLAALAVLFALFILAVVFLLLNLRLPALLCFLIHGTGMAALFYLDVLETDKRTLLEYYDRKEEQSTARMEESDAVDADKTALEHELLESLKEKCRMQGEELEHLRLSLAENENACRIEQEHSAALAQQMLENSLLPEVKISNSFEPVNILSIASNVIGELMASAAAAHVNIQLSAASASIMVKADPSRIRLLFRNIIDNSIKYMQRSGSLVITISNLGDDIFIVLKDNGNGLSEAETEHIFELNYQGSNRISGNGLGLTQARAIVNAYGGTIYARSAPGKGMGIYIQLPVD